MTFMRDKAHALALENTRLRRLVREGEESVLMYRCISAMMSVAFVLAIAWPSDACAGTTAGNWCSEYGDGYYTGFCWRGGCDSESVPPVMCPYPNGGEDAYTRGLKEGLAAARLREQESGE